VEHEATDEQRAVLESLPTGAATRQAVFEDHRALASAFRHHARAACDALEVAWPHELEVATIRYLRAHGVDIDG
jgi:hypothetical protein